jgi:hypothetical protein
VLRCWCYQCRRSSPVVMSIVASYVIARTTPLYNSLMPQSRGGLDVGRLREKVERLGDELRRVVRVQDIRGPEGEDNSVEERL